MKYSALFQIDWKEKKGKRIVNKTKSTKLSVESSESLSPEQVTDMLVVQLQPIYDKIKTNSGFVSFEGHKMIGNLETT